MSERQSENSYSYPHNREFFRSIGISRVEAAGLFLSDCLAIAIRERPSDGGGTWPSDFRIVQHLEDSGLDNLKYIRTSTQ